MLVLKDLGGIKNKEGKTIKENQLIRSSSLYKLRKKEINLLKNHHLSKVIDLRTTAEKEEKEDTIIEGVTYLHLPIFKEQRIGITRENDKEKLKNLDNLKNLPDISELYKIMVTEEYSISQIKTIIHEILETNSCTLFHCTAGKDRTGVITMLLLSILDVEETTIIENYLEINKHQKFQANLYYFLIKLKTKNTELATKAKNYFLAKEEYLKSSMNTIKENYGSMENFIKNTLEVTKDQKEKFKNKILI